MDKPNSNLHFYLHVIFFRVRDFLFPRIHILKEAGIKPGFHVVDYGCGPGSYIVSLLRLVGESGRVYAVDAQPLAIQKIKDIISAKQLKNVEAICSDCKTGLPDNSIDAVLFYDVFHALSDSEAVLGELYRVLRPRGILSFQDHRMRNEAIMDKFIKAKFQLLRKGEKTYTFQKAKL